MANRVITRPAIGGIDAGQRSQARMQRGRVLHRAGKIGFVFSTLAAYFFLWAPILLLVAFSFNAGNNVNTWEGFSTSWYANIFRGTIGSEERFATDLMLSALKNSLIVSLSATVIATIIGTMVALSLARGNFPGKKLVDGILFLPVVIPEITQGVSLAMFFVVVFNFMEMLTGQRVNSGFGTIIIGHVVFNISYVAIVVRARLAGMNPRLEEAAADLGASPWRTFWRVTFPLILPGVIAGALLAVTISLDDFVVTFFMSGVGTTTLPIFVYGLLKRSVTPEINAISTLMLVASTVLIGISLVLQGRSVANRG
jgi:spermidine/putrescine transport system permease protein